jgi:hypothetical protein
LAVLRGIKESDWRIWRELLPIAQERFFERVLAEIDRIASEIDKSSYERYLAIYKLIHRRDKELANALSDLRRSTALEQLALIQAHSLLTEEEMSRFSDETREIVALFLGR